MKYGYSSYFSLRSMFVSFAGEVAQYLSGRTLRSNQPYTIFMLRISDMNCVFPGYTTYLRYIYLVLMVYAGKMFEFLHVLTSLYGWQQYCF